MKLRHGFKSQSEKRSVEIRRKLGLREIDPLLSTDLALDMGVMLRSALEIPDLSDADLKQLTKTDPDSWSAFTLRKGNKHLIVYNTAQSTPRVNSVVMHELAHITLGHQLADVLSSDEGHLIVSHYNQEQESEADWLGSTLLLPRPALLWMRKNKMTEINAAKHFKVSSSMLSWRIKMTGIDHQLSNRRKKYG